MGLRPGDIFEIGPTRFLTPEQAARAWAIEELDHWFAENCPAHRVTEAERHDAIYNDKWPVREYTVTEDTRIDVLTGHAIIPMKPSV